LHTVQLPLPCKSDFWEAETAQEWAHSHPITAIPEPNLQFLELVDDIFQSRGEAARKITSVKSRRIVVVSVSRMIWQVREMQASTPSYRVRHRPFMQEELNDALQVLDQLYRQVTAIAPVAIISDTIQAIHMTHLHASRGLMNWVYRSLKDSNDSGKIGDITAIPRWPAYQTDTARQAVLHCANIISADDIRQTPHQNRSMRFTQVLPYGF
jgi:hypothetical protein